MRILVTGAGGFVGRALCPALKAACHRVHACVRSQAGTAGLELAGTLQVADIGPETDWGDQLSGFDAIVHLAARVHVMRETAADPLDAFRRVNVGGTRHLAEAAAAAGVERLVFLSTVKVMGEATTTRPFTESDPLRPEDAYGISKMEAEMALAAVSEASSLTAVALRPPLVYGPGVKGNFLSLLSAVQRGLPLPFGSIDNQRSLIYLGNLVSAIVAALEVPEIGSGGYLIRDGEDLSTPELVRGMAAALERPARLLPIPPGLLRLAGRLSGRTGAVDRLLGSLQVDDDAFRRDTGWTPGASVVQGLADTATWYRGDRVAVDQRG